MAGRTFAIGDIHGDLKHLLILLSRLPPLDAEDTLVFLGDYVDRGPDSAKVVEHVRALPSKTPAKVVCLRGNHEDAWLKVIEEGWPGFVLPPLNGCLAAYRSYVGGPAPEAEDVPRPPELSGYTPDDPTDLWAGIDVVGIDTGCGKGGFLTAVEFPACNVYESR
jgi:serine/threonine protein phosphatase 1